MKIFLYALTMCFLLAGCAPSTFLIQKGTSNAYYFGSESKKAYEMLCSGGELKKVLRDAELHEDIKDELYRYVCTEARSFDKVVSLYIFLTPEEKKNLKSAFVKHDFIINTVRC